MSLVEDFIDNVGDIDEKARRVVKSKRNKRCVSVRVILSKKSNEGISVQVAIQGNLHRVVIIHRSIFDWAT